MAGNNLPACSVKSLKKENRKMKKLSKTTLVIIRILLLAVTLSACTGGYVTPLC